VLDLGGDVRGVDVDNITLENIRLEGSVLRLLQIGALTDWQVSCCQLYQHCCQLLSHFACHAFYSPRIGFTQAQGHVSNVVLRNISLAGMPTAGALESGGDPGVSYQNWVMQNVRIAGDCASTWTALHVTVPTTSVGNTSFSCSLG
jgi:hypothetical protein